MPRGEYNEWYDRQMSLRDAENRWLEEQGLPQADEEITQNEPIVNNRIMREQEALLRRRRERAMARARAREGEGNRPAIRQADAESQRRRAAEWARSQGFLVDETPANVEENTNGGRKKKTQKHPRKSSRKSSRKNLKKHSKKSYRKHSRKH